jgi:hypothetical protein
MVKVQGPSNPECCKCIFDICFIDSPRLRIEYVFIYGFNFVILLDLSIGFSACLHFNIKNIRGGQMLFVPHPFHQRTRSQFS